NFPSCSSSGSKTASCRCASANPTTTRWRKSAAAVLRGPVALKHPYLPGDVALIDNVDPPPDVMDRLLGYWLPVVEKKRRAGFLPAGPRDVARGHRVERCHRQARKVRGESRARLSVRLARGGAGAACRLPRLPGGHPVPDDCLDKPEDRAPRRA